MVVFTPVQRLVVGPVDIMGLSRGPLALPSTGLTNMQPRKLEELEVWARLKYKIQACFDRACQKTLHSASSQLQKLLSILQALDNKRAEIYY